MSGEGPSIVQKHTWGLDLAGQYGQAGQDGAASLTAAGAGGIGGLLATFDAGSPGTTGDDVSYIFCVLAGGDAHPTRNVGQLVDLSAETLSAGLVGRYEYDAYGNVTGPDDNQNGDWLEGAGPQAAANAHRFSTKPFDADTGMGDWGHRWYDPRTGRWVSRDPIGERGGANVYLHARNNPTEKYDALGLYVDRGAACREFCQRYSYDTGLMLACHNGCEAGWNETMNTVQYCNSACWAHRSFRGKKTDASNACELGCLSGTPDFGRGGSDCLSHYSILGHGASGTDPVTDDGKTVNQHYIAKVVCPKLCWGATLTFYTCGTGGNTRFLQKLISACPKIASATACTADLLTNEDKYVFTYWCEGTWVTVSNPGARAPGSY